MNPTETLHFEELAVGDAFETGGRTVTRAEIIAFADRYDPQPFHVDAEAVEESVFDDLVASGLHTMALANRLVTDDFYAHTSVMGGTGIEEANFLAPVRAGDTLSVRVEIVGKRASASKPDRGLVTVEQTVSNQADETVLTLRITSFFRRRSGDER
ncbi:MaoC family dehydratase [Haloprofundus sp. MHR1]|uniref:MaoC family dehydratase n=1 Tax=Haloprofundus sp. MHR1 TaxID=2572921 RepID=UPI0010BE6CB8|nr:MaoC family dehydratase [Haloprofundus sp. MHR1]QCJ47102.1 MaoC family dehydratase [Haloprofundus sp. MHR1]